MDIREKIAPFFEGYTDTLVWSYLQGHMGAGFTDDAENPAAGQIAVADFCFLAGRASADFAATAACSVIVPQNAAWEKAIEEAFGKRATRFQRYAIRRQENFDTERLTAFAGALPKGFFLAQIDEALYHLLMAEGWSEDLCRHFQGPADYLKRGLGFAALHRGRPMAGASSYTVYTGGIEIEIDTKEEFRQRGLATACGAALILECLRRGLYPGWDAYDLRSVALAEKLGYAMSHPYTAYEIQE